MTSISGAGDGSRLFGQHIEVLGFWLAVLTLIALIATAWIYLRVLHAQRDAVVSQRTALEAQVLLAVWDRLQAQPVRDARGDVLTFAEADLEPGRWERSADIVGQTYDATGIMCREGLLPVERIRAWKGSILRCHERCLPYIEFRRASEANPGLWTAFDWLVEQLRALPDETAVDRF